MRINNINTTQNFGSPISKNGYLARMKYIHTDMYNHLNDYSTPEYRKHVTQNLSAILAIDKLSPNYTIGIYPEKLKDGKLIPKFYLVAIPLDKKNSPVKIDISDLNFPSLQAEDYIKIAFYVNLIENMKLK